jgi:alpha-beta hydrolase superfamily lysophospholipase
MTETSDWTESGDGTRLFWRRRTAGPAARATLLFVHGLAEHSGRYMHVLDHFAARGFDCWGLDYRGHGQSPGLRVHVDRFGEFDEDVAAVRHLAATTCDGLPLVLVGHSQGGLLVLRQALAEPQGLAGIIVSSPFLGIHPASKPPAALQVVANIVSTFAKRLMFSKVADPSLLSRQPGIAEAYVADPLVSSTVSARWFTEVVRAQTETRAGAAGLAVPALIMQSGGDRLADPAATRSWADNAPTDLVEYIEWDGFYHEMFNEPEREQVFARMERWLQALIGDHRSNV